MSVSDRTSYGTPFVESELILAALAEDMDTVRALIGEMLPGEKRVLEEAAHWLWRELYRHGRGGP